MNPRRLRVVGVTLLIVAGCVNYADRSALSIAASDVGHDMGLSVGAVGVLLSAFAWSYGLAQLPVGALVDRIGARWTIGGGLMLWSLAQMVGGMVRTFPQFVLARVALGAGEAPMYTGGARVCTDWYAPKERALPIGLFNASSALGPAIAPPILTAIMVAAGWRAMFVVVGAAGLLIGLVWLLVYRDAQPFVPRPFAPQSADTSAGMQTPRAGWRETIGLLRLPTSWALMLGLFGVVYLTWLYVTWLPGYLEMQRHVSVARTGTLAAIPQVFGFVGAVGGGVLSDWLTRRGMDPARACRLPLLTALCVAAVATVMAAYADSTFAALACMSAAVGCASLASTCGWALAAAVAPSHQVAQLEAIQNIGGSLGGSLAPLVTGLIVQATGSFVPALLLAAAVSVVSGVSYWFVR